MTQTTESRLTTANAFLDALECPEVPETRSILRVTDAAGRVVESYQAAGACYNEGTDGGDAKIALEKMDESIDDMLAAAAELAAAMLELTYAEMVVLAKATADARKKVLR